MRIIHTNKFAFDYAHVSPTLIESPMFPYMGDGCHPCSKLEIAHAMMHGYGNVKNAKDAHDEYLTTHL